MGIFGGGNRGFFRRLLHSTSEHDELRTGIAEAEQLIERRQFGQALEVLWPLADEFPNDARVQSLLGSCYYMEGNMYAAVDALERANKLSRSPDASPLLFAAYMSIEMLMHASKAAQGALPADLTEEITQSIHEGLAIIREEVDNITRETGRPRHQIEKGLTAYEDARLALMRDEYSVAIDASKRAFKQMGPWPPLGTLLASVYFFDGRPNEAVSELKKVLQHAPDDIFALESLIRYLTWYGKRDQAAPYWERLKTIAPYDDETKSRLAGAATVMEEDAMVADLMPQLLSTSPEPNPLEIRHLATALANLGKHKQALQQLHKLDVDDLGPTLNLWTDALKQKRPGPGYADRYPYYTSIELMHADRIFELMELMSKRDTLSEQQFRRRMDRFAARFPQLHLMCRKLIWEENQSVDGVEILAAIGTPEAHAIIHEFALSQAGDDIERTRALIRLMEAGYLATGAEVRFWHSKTREWRAVKLITNELTDEPDSDFSEQELALMEKGIIALRENDLDTAEDAFKQLLTLAPQSKEALNNLGNVYSLRGDHAAAQAMFQAAYDIDPDYLYARCNLASGLLADGDVQGARAMIAPLFQKPRMHIQDMAHLNLTSAAISMSEGDFEAARRSVKVALDLYPELTQAEQLLRRIEMAELADKFANLSGFFYQDRSASKRAKMQRTFTSTDVALKDAIGLFSVEVMKEISRDVVYPYQSPHGRKRAALHDWLVEGLLDPEILEGIVDSLGQEERDALRTVVANGGVMPWADFDRDYGNDLEESVYWQYHRPQTLMGKLRFRGLLTEATVANKTYILVPLELRAPLRQLLALP